MLLVSQALTDYCKDSNIHNPCNHFTDVSAYEDGMGNQTISFTNGNDDRFLLNCQNSTKELSCHLTKQFRVMRAGCSGGPSIGDNIYSDTDVQHIYPNDVEKDAQESECAPYKKYFLEKSGEEMVEKTFDIPNFPKTVYFYFGKDLPESDRTAFIEKFAAAATEIAHIAKKYYGLLPSFSSLDVFVRPECVDYASNPDLKYKAGTAAGDQVRIVPMLDTADGCLFSSYIERGGGLFPVKVILHELFHFYAFPGFAEPHALINEANAVFLMNLVHGPEDQYYQSFFPDNPVLPVDSISIGTQDTLDQTFYDLDGNPHTLSIVDILEDSFSFIEGAVLLMQLDKEHLIGPEIGKCEKIMSLGLFVCVEPLDDANFSIYVYDNKDSIHRPYLYINSVTPSALYQVPIQMIYGQTAGGNRAFMETPMGRGPHTFSFDGIDHKLTDTNQYRAAEFLLAGLQQLFFEYRPHDHPNQLFFELGLRAIKCRENGECPTLTEGLAEIIGAPYEAISDYLSSFGLDPTLKSPLEPICYPFE